MVRIVRMRTGPGRFVIQLNKWGLMSGLIAGGEVGNVFVVTTNNRGMNAEEMADLAINRILNVSDNTPMP
jgi:hypothetical protein